MWPFKKKKIVEPTHLMVIDVESVGLHGEAFAVGYVVVTLNGTVLEERLFACDPSLVKGDDEGKLWIANNVPVLDVTHSSPREMREAFWKAWMHWSTAPTINTVMVADCAWPVEARFLAACIDDDRHHRRWQGPFPLHEVATMLLARGIDPHEDEPRTMEEMPLHNPLKDARHSARKLIHAWKHGRIHYQNLKT